MGKATWLVLCLFLVALFLLPFASGAAPARQGSEGARDFVFLSEGKPILIRLDVRIEGKPVQAAWADFMKYLFNYLDVDGDGMLSKEEAERAPSVSQILAGGLAGNGRRGGGDTKGPSLAALDTNGDGKVSLAELSAWYGANGLAPLTVRSNSGQAAVRGGLALLGRGADPDPDAVREAIFKILDTNGDGRLSKEELAAAPAVLLRLDDDQDEMITARELVPNPKRGGGFLAAMRMGGLGSSGSDNARKVLVSIARMGEAPSDLIGLMQKRYGRKWTDKEVAEFVKRPADLELKVHLGSKVEERERIEVAGAGALLGGKVKKMGDLALIDLGVARLDLKPGESEENAYGSFADLIRQQVIAQFRQADKDNKGYLTQKDAEASRQFRGRFAAMDRDGDGKLYEKEVIAWFDQYQKIQARATASGVSLVLDDQSRGLFDLLDVNRDKRLSVREMRGAVGLLKQLDRQGKGYLTKADLPRLYAVTVQPGMGDTAALGGAAAFAALYRTSDGTKREGKRTGPLWFRKMDRNRDGDVSRKEWLFSEELFKQIDTDGDGLLSVEEAERYDALRRKRE
jgi:Ca2+-binding EF-hand superfamily protein